MPGWDLQRIRQARILVAGAGALGNEVLKNLALIGIGAVYLLDFDTVEQGNLNRSILYRREDVGQPKAEAAARSLREINPDMQVHHLQTDVMHGLGLGLVRRMDALIGCVDNRLARLWLNRWAFRAGKPWVSGGILQLSGQVEVYAPGQACYECGLSAAAWRDIQVRMGCTDMARRYISTGQAPTTSIAASVIGALQVREALGLALGQEGLSGRMWSFEGLSHHAAVYELRPPGADCESHQVYGPVREFPELSAETPLGEALGVLEAAYGEGLWIELDHGVATEVATMISKKVHPVLVPLPQLSDEFAERYREIAGEGVAVTRKGLHVRLDREFPRQDATLKELGIPSLHILRLRTGEETHYAELSKDLAAMGLAGVSPKAP